MIFSNKKIIEDMRINKDVIRNNKNSLQEIYYKSCTNLNKLRKIYWEYLVNMREHGYYKLIKNKITYHVGEKIPNKKDESAQYFENQEEIIKYLENRIKQLRIQNGSVKMSNSKLIKSIWKLEIEIDHKKKCLEYLNNNKAIIIKRLPNIKENNKQKMKIKDCSRNSKIISNMMKEGDK